MPEKKSAIIKERIDPKTGKKIVTIRKKKKPEAKAKPAPSPAKPKTLAQLKKEAKEKGIKGFSGMNRKELELQLQPRNKKLLQSYSDKNFGNLIQFLNMADDEFSEEELKKGKRPSLLKEASSFLFSPRDLHADLAFKRKKMDEVRKEETMRLINNLDKAFGIDIKKGSKLQIR